MDTLWTLLLFLLATETYSSHTHQGLTCVNDYIYTLSCIYHPTDHSADNCTLYSFRDTFRGLDTRHCELRTLNQTAQASRGCLLKYNLRFWNADQLTLELRCAGQLVRRVERYRPSQHIKMHTPGSPVLSNHNLSWSAGQPLSSTIELYSSQLQFKPAGQPWMDVKPLDVVMRWVELDNGSMEVGKWYQARVRVQSVRPKSSHWSDWSPALTWRSEVGTVKISLNQGGLMTKFYVGLAVVAFSTILVSIYLFFTRSRCLQKHQHVPDPSQFFQDLHSIHGGDFQKWLHPQPVLPSVMTPKQCDNIYPVEEVEECEQEDLFTMAMLFPPIHRAGSATGKSSSGQSSGFSNMGYFYSEYQPGSLCLETCPVYFTYHAAGGSGVLHSTGSYKCLQGEPRSPDSGFGMGGGEEDEAEIEETSLSNEPSIPFILSLPQVSSFPLSASEQQNTPQGHASMTWAQVSGTPNCTYSPKHAEGNAARPASLIVQPCSSGYVTLKELHSSHSNNSI